MQNSKRKYILIIIILVLVVLLSGCSDGVNSGSFLTLNFLPSGIKTITGHRMFDGNIESYTIPVIGVILERIINFFIVLFINVVDFLLWFISWIPIVKKIILFVYSSPDLDLAFNNIFYFHRNFITHSVLNPVFLLLVILNFVFKETTYIRGFIIILMLCFLCHLLADSMPVKWIGFSRITVGIMGIKFFILPPILSKIWLYFNSFFIFSLSMKYMEE